METSFHRVALFLVCVLALAGVTYADTGPGGEPVFVDIWITPGSGEPVELHVPLIAAQAIGEHAPIGGGFEVTWDISADPDPFIASNWTIQNTLAVPQTFTLGTSIPVNPNLVPPNVMGGSVSGSITDIDAGGATLSTNSPNSVYTAMINGSMAATLLDDSYSVSAGSFQSMPLAFADFGNPIPSAPAPNVTITSIGINLEFVLGPGDSAALTSVFVVDVPEPATLSLLAIGGLPLLRRRR